MHTNKNGTLLVVGGCHCTSLNTFLKQAYFCWTPFLVNGIRKHDNLIWCVRTKLDSGLKSGVCVGFRSRTLGSNWIQVEILLREIQDLNLNSISFRFALDQIVSIALGIWVQKIHSLMKFGFCIDPIQIDRLHPYITRTSVSYFYLFLEQLFLVLQFI